MARYRLSQPAKADIAAILRRSEELHGKEARIRYRACLAAAMRRGRGRSGGTFDSRSGRELVRDLWGLRGLGDAGLWRLRLTMTHLSLFRRTVALAAAHPAVSNSSSCRQSAHWLPGGLDGHFVPR